MTSNRTAMVTRTTSESSVELTLDLDGTGVGEVSTGVRFYDHMLLSLAKHSLIDLRVKATGDVDVDAHHTVEDVAIVLGEALPVDTLHDWFGVPEFGIGIEYEGEEHTAPGRVLRDISHIARAEHERAEDVGDLERGRLAQDVLHARAHREVSVAAQGADDVVYVTVSAGIVVTRVSTDEETSNVGSDISRQLLRNPRPIMIGAALSAFAQNADLSALWPAHGVHRLAGGLTVTM